VVKTVRTEVLDWTLIFSRKHLDRVLRTYVSHYNAERPHRGLELAVPDKPCNVAPVDEIPAIGRRDLFGGLIKEYRTVAA
jgi:Integrase core domain